MTWPNSTKAGTTNVDQGTDKPSLARADIKQNIDNVNAIIDTFDIASPSNGDLLQYNSKSGAWEPVASTSVGSSAPEMAIVRLFGEGENVSNNIWRRPIIEMVDPGSIVANNGDYQITLGAGTYYFEAVITGNADGNEVPVNLYNETTSTDNNFINPAVPTINHTASGMDSMYTFGTSTNISFRQDTNTSAYRNGIFIIKIYKF